jgi:hypothetical protein
MRHVFLVATQYPKKGKTLWWGRGVSLAGRCGVKWWQRKNASSGSMVLAWKDEAFTEMAIG